MIGLPKSSSVIPVARQRPLAPAILRPCVVVLERYGIIILSCLKVMDLVLPKI